MEGGRTKCVSCQQQQQSEMITPNSERPRCLASCSFHRNQNPFPGEGRRGFRAKLKSMMSGNVSPKAESLNRKPLPAESSQARSKKRALLCGVSYKKQKYKLRGTINDVRRIRELLVDTFNFPVESIRVLTGILLPILAMIAVRDYFWAALFVLPVAFSHSFSNSNNL